MCWSHQIRKVAPHVICAAAVLIAEGTFLTRDDRQVLRNLVLALSFKEAEGESVRALMTAIPSLVMTEDTSPSGAHDCTLSMQIRSTQQVTILSLSGGSPFSNT